jgi:hypothetical protein
MEAWPDQAGSLQRYGTGLSGWYWSNRITSTFLNETRTSRDLASTAIFQLMAGVGMIFVNGDMASLESSAKGGPGALDTVFCEATTTFNDSLGIEIVISVTDARS